MNIIGEFAALVTAICWSGSSISFAEATRRIGSVTINVLRLWVAAFFFLITILLFQFSLALKFPQLFYLMLSGFIGLTLGDTFLFKAYQCLGARLTMLFMSLSPAVSAIIAFFFLSESLTVLDLLGMIITITGIIFVVTEKRGSESSNIFKSGYLFALLAAVGQGVSLIFAKFAFTGGEINGFIAAFTRIVAGLITLTPLAILSGRFKNPVVAMKNDKIALKYTLLGSFLGPYLGITLSMIAVEYSKVGIAATIMSLVPVLMLPLLKIFYKEKISFRAFIGAAIAVTGVAILFLC